MTCELYNITKEGDLRNIPTNTDITVLGFDAINALYDGDPTIPATTISGTPGQIGVLAEFGESYDICHVNYYTAASGTIDISIKYGVTSGTENVATVTMIGPGTYQGLVSSYARFVEVIHTFSGIAVDINQLEIIAFRNETLGFGYSANEPIERLYLPHATADGLSASANVIPIFNDNHFEDIARIAVAPTFTSADKYVKIGTSSSGTFYGINDFAIRQPGPNPMNHEDDTMLAEELHPQWVRSAKHKTYNIIPTQEGLLFDLAYGGAPYSPTAGTIGIISKDFFTAHSFTAELEAKFTVVRSTAVNGSLGRMFMFYLTNSHGLPDVAYFANTQTDARKGTSGGGLVFRANSTSNTIAQNWAFSFRTHEGTNSDNPSGDFVDLNFWLPDGTGFPPVPTGDTKNHTTFGVTTMEDMINQGQSLNVFNPSAEWHKFRLVYDHVRRELSGYINNVLFGREIFNLEDFKEGCKLFIGTQGYAGVQFTIRNFKFYPDRIYNQRNVAAKFRNPISSATISGTPSNVANLIDGTSTPYVGPEPTGLAKVRIDFDKPYDVTRYTIRQRAQGTGTSAFGKTYFPDVARTCFVDYGGKRTELNFLPNSSSDVIRTPTISGSLVPTISGISYVEWQFLSYDETPQPNGALVIEEISVFAEETVEASILSQERDSTRIPWVEGRWRNLKQSGSGNFLSLRTRHHREAAIVIVPEYYKYSVTYGSSPAFCGRQFATSSDFHHGQALFTAVGLNDYESLFTSATIPNPLYVWRQFDEERRVIGTYISFRISNFFVNLPNEFKFQSLRPGGNPNNEIDWLDIHPVTKPHTDLSTGENRLYARYKQFFIENNDGEFYTNYINLPNDSEPGVLFGSITAGTNFLVGKIFWPGTNLDAGQQPTLLRENFSNVSSQGADLFIEFDEPVATRAIRIYAKTPVVQVSADGTIGGTTNSIGVSEWHIFTSDTSGSYASPVFDTGTKQNTERVAATIRLPEGTRASIFARSYSEPPSFSYDPEYETWRALGDLGDINFGLPNVGGRDRVITIGDKAYFILANAAYVYNFKTTAWSFETGGYPSNGDANTSGDFDAGDGLGFFAPPTLVPDSSVNNSVALINNVIYVAAINIGDGQPSTRIMKLDLSVQPLTWVGLIDNRPPSASNAAMAAYGDNLYFFNRSGGSVFRWSSTDFNWVELDAIYPNFGGFRIHPAITTYKDKIYIFGQAPGSSSSATFATTIFDPVKEIFTSGASPPRPITSHFAVAVEEENVIYIFPTNTGGVGDPFFAAMKYFPEKNTWDYAESLMHHREYRNDQSDEGNRFGTSYFYHTDGYLYKLASSTWGRTLVRRPPWSPGKSPHITDEVWGGVSGLSNVPWKNLGDFGELLPQERYFQFKVELYSDDGTSSPVLEDIRIVMPQSIPVPASGTANVYVKIGVEEDAVFQAWYSGSYWRPQNGNTHNFSILSTRSSDGIEWGFPTVASGVNFLSFPENSLGASSPWVIQNSVIDYEFWWTRDRGSAFDTFSEDPTIYYSRSTSPDDMSENLRQLAIPSDTLTQTTGGVLQPSVIKHSSTNYKIWFTGVQGSLGAGTRRIIHASSTNGVSWTGQQVVIGIGTDLAHGYDAVGAYRPSVIYDGGLYRMWYTGIGSDSLERILYRESTDGVSWSPLQLNIDVGSQGFSDGRGASRAVVTLDADNTFYVYYFGVDDSGSTTMIIRAESPDGLDWDNFKVVLPAAGFEGKLDGNGIKDFFVLVDRNPVIPGEVFTTAQIKIHNEGASL